MKKQLPVYRTQEVGFSMDYLPFSLEYTNYIHSIFVITTSTVLLFSNFLLLYVIFTTPTDHIGSYRFLLALFSVNDIAITLGYAALQPYIHMASTGFYIFPRHGGIMISGCQCYQIMLNISIQSTFAVPVDTLLCTLFIGTFYHMFLLLAFQFVYRYKTVTRGIGSSCTDYWSKCQWTTIGAVIYALYMAVYLMAVEIGMKPSDAARESMPTEIYATYGVNLSDPTAGFLVVAVRNVNDTTNDVDWNVESTISLALSVGLFGAVSFIIAYCIHQISMAIESSKTPVAPATRKAHREMFRALLMQTIVPCMCSYIPLSTILLVGSVTGIPLGTYGNALFITTAIFPTLNAVFVLYFVTKFRNAVVHTFKLPSAWAEAPVKL
ncbi:hypothetical protein PRIPAC_97274, partial [Pristionchus pacificus]|uniref:G protein-coupled receptor n=1 Tax=Pristionchus pacificus TaxID=54126 RepID=A0A2A6D1S8_PRIPA